MADAAEHTRRVVRVEGREAVSRLIRGRHSVITSDEW